MYLLFIVPIVAIFVALVAVQFYDKHREGSAEKEYLPYVKRSYLMTQAEHNFYKVLEEAVAGKYHIVPQVKLSSIIDVNRYAKNKYIYRNKIDRKSVDFVLFEKEHFTPYLVIELDETSHQLPEREDRDRLVDAIMEKVGLKIEHVKTSYAYNLREIEEKIS